MEGRAKPIHSHLYTGPTHPAYHNREFWDYQNEWQCKLPRNKEVGSLDDNIYNQLLNAKNQGRKGVTLLDLGCGDGGFLRSFIEFYANKQYEGLGKTRDFLRKNPEININFVGLTDAPAKESFLKSEDLTQEKAASTPQLKVEKVYYSLMRGKPNEEGLSSGQRLKDFLKLKGINSLDLIFATHSFTYFPPQLFSEVLEDAINSLNKGGKMIVAGYIGSHAPGFRQIGAFDARMRFDTQKTEPFALDLKHFSALKGKIFQEALEKRLPFTQVIDALKTVLKKYLAIRAINREQVKEINRAISAFETGSIDEKLAMTVLMLHVNRLLSVAEHELFLRKSKSIRRAKIRIINNLRKKLSGTATFTKSERLMLIEK